MTVSTDHLDDLRVGFVPHPAEAARRYRDTGLFADTALWQVLDRADTHPDDPALTDASSGSGGNTLSYAQLRSAVYSRAAGYVRAGLTRGQRVILQQNNTAAFVIDLLGLLRAGVVPVMALPAHRVNEIAHLAEGAGAVGYVGEDARSGYDFRDLAGELVSRVPAVRQVFIAGDPGEFVTPPNADPDTVSLPDAVDPDLPALLLVSGGTTGLPKLIARSHNDYLLNARLSASAARLDTDDIYLAALPAAHNFPLCCPGLFGAWLVGAHAVLIDNPSPDNAFDIIERHRVTVTALVPALAQLWCAATEWEPAEISSLRLLQVGGSKLAQADAVALDKAFGDVVQQVFGMAEGLICYTALDDPRDLVHIVQGVPMSEHDEVRVVDEAGKDVARGAEGELLVRGPYTIRGYYRADEHNLRSFTPDGYYRSGDRVRQTESGHIAVTGRIKDTIVRAGENVAADDIEEHLLAHDAVHQAAVIGTADPALGERISALVVRSIGATADPTLPELRAFLRQRGLATFKLPDELHVVAVLPVTAVGKIDKAALRRMH